MFALITSGVLALSLVLVTVLKYKFIAKKKCLLGRHVIVTGGSSGIGKCIALEAAKIGANVTIVARNENRLRSALEEIKGQCSYNDQKFNYLSVDLAGDYNMVKTTLNNAIDEMGPLCLFINCAGMAICGTLEDISSNDIMTKNFGIKVTLALPPDTDTPGYANESKDKPLETLLISETANLFTPEEVGRQILQDTLDGRFFSTVGFEGHMMTISCAGMAPYTSYLELICQVFCAGILRLITVYYQSTFDKIIKKCKLDREHLKNNKT
ncbi:3-ketodihydrosphingosine reductase isoform X2 [Acyrthosiphon pisum]|uniref:3-ketodihydrosphingosine reductase n=1 Tax=Acyrthosiphon pisum TaxID=7029 RepID=A0A8R2H7H7_ACYPI|nr:3-ketodihydrosphingosine reductase isoform X2 [Acyrthosiphon pisum]|eukprot:XP_016663454.1 PREDICTED: 3-ketodihydrosphingosine reductase isoform X3 [Acyrthosiphon pisum]